MGDDEQNSNTPKELDDKEKKQFEEQWWNDSFFNSSLDKNLGGEFSQFNFLEYRPEGENITSYVLDNRGVCIYKLRNFEKSEEEIKFRIICKPEYQIEGKVKSMKDNFVCIETKDKKEIFINLDEIDCRTIFPLSYNPIKYPNRYIPNQVREYILKRDNHKCQLELDGCTEMAEEIDHIIPLSKGGEGVIENLQASCLNCNRKKGNII